MTSARTIILSMPPAFSALLLIGCWAFSPPAYAQEEEEAEEQATQTSTAATTDTETNAETDADTEDKTEAKTEAELETELGAETEIEPAQLNPVLIDGVKSPRLVPILRPRLAPVLKQDSPTREKDSPEHDRLWGSDRPAMRSVVPPARPAEKPQTSAIGPDAEAPPTPMTAGGKVGGGPKANPRLKRRLAEGKRMLTRGSLGSAREILLQLAKQAPKSAEAPEALFYAATAQEDLTLVRDELRGLVRKYPRSGVTHKALGRIGEISLILGDYAESLSAFRALRRVSDRPEHRRDASSKIILALVRSGAFEQAADEIENAVAEYPDLRRAPEIVDAHGEALLGSGQYGAGSALLAGVETQFPNYEFAAKVLLNRGLCEELGGNAAEASEIYRAVRSRFPDGIESSLAAARLRDLSIPLNAPPHEAASPSRQSR